MLFSVDTIVAARRYVHDFTRRYLPVVADKYRGREAVQRGAVKGSGNKVAQDMCPWPVSRSVVDRCGVLKLVRSAVRLRGPDDQGTTHFFEAHNLWRTVSIKQARLRVPLDVSSLRLNPLDLRPSAATTRS